MPLQHVVILKVKPEFFENPAFTELMTASKDLKKIDGVLQVSLGRNITERISDPKERLVLQVLMKDKDTLDRYGPHELHQKFVSILGPWKLDLMAVDYLFDQ